MAGFAVTVSVIDAASAKLEAINKKLALMRAPVERLQRSFERLASASGITGLVKGFQNLARYALEAFQFVGRIVAPLGIITGALSLGGMAQLVTRWAEFGDRLGFAAARLGLSADRLQALQGAAKLAGASSEALTNGMKTLGDTLTDAVAGRAPEAVVMLNTLHVGFRNADGSARKAVEVLPELADKIAAIKNPSLQARAATALFGGAAEELLPFLRKGSAGIAEYTAMAQRYGVMNEGATKGAREFKEAQTKLSLATEGLANTLIEKLAPGLVPLIERMAEWTAANRDWMATGLVGELEKFKTFLEDIGNNPVFKFLMMTPSEALHSLVQGEAKPGSLLEKLSKDQTIFGQPGGPPPPSDLDYMGQPRVRKQSYRGPGFGGGGIINAGYEVEAGQVNPNIPNVASLSFWLMRRQLADLQKADPSHMEAPWWAMLPGGEDVWKHQVFGRIRSMGMGRPGATRMAIPPMVGSAAEHAAYIRERAAAYGIDPDVALRVARSEGLGGPFAGDAGSSYGDFQLHRGGIAGGGNRVGGLGDLFMQRTGLDPSDPANWRAMDDFALAQAAQGGWGPWHGWRGPRYAGIAQGPAVAGPPDAASATGAQGAPGPNGKLDMTIRIPPNVQASARASGDALSGAPRIEMSMPYSV